MSEPPVSKVAILNAALELPVDERAAYLDRACAGQPELRQLIDELLLAHEQSGEFLEAPATGLELQRSSLGGAPLTEKPGDRIGRYKLLQQIGEGGCGVVYMAEQEEPVRRRVALKVIKLGMDTRQVITRFEAERQALALMDHPNIARVLDAGATDTGRPFFVMELVRGVKITDFCSQNDISTQDCLRLFIQVCQAIQHAHQKGVIHRDIKPSNILVTVNDGTPVPKVIDFGIAKATQGRLTDKTLFTAFEQFIGTPAYMSPEQAVMTSLDIDTRSDIYSLGVLLYELLTGCTPFDAQKLLAAGLDEMRRTIRETEPPKPSTRLTQELETAEQAGRISLTPGTALGADPRRLLQQREMLRHLRGDLDWIVMKCLEKDRVRRYQSASGLAADLQRHLNDEPIVARPPGRLYVLRKLARRNRRLVATVAALTFTILAALVILVVSNLRITAETRQKSVALAAVRASEAREREQLFLSLRNQAEARRFSQRTGQRLDSLAALTDAARLRPDDALRDDAIAAMALPDIHRGVIWHGFPTGTLGIGFDQLYRRCARLDTAGQITVRSVPEDVEIQHFNLDPITAEQFAGFVFSPDGQLLATIDPGHRLCLWRIEDGQAVFSEAPPNCLALAFRPDGQQLALAQCCSSENRGEIALFDLPSARELRRWPTPDLVYSLAFDGSGHRLAVGYEVGGSVSIFGATNGALLAELPVGTNRQAVVAWNPDGRRLAVAGFDPRIQIWDVDSRIKMATLEGHEPAVTSLSFNPAGTFLLSCGWDGVARLWDLDSCRSVLQVPSVARLQFSADGRWLGADHLPGGDLQMLELVPTREYRTFGKITAGYMEGEASPDGRWLALGAGDGVHLFESSSGRQLAFLPIGFTSSAFFSSPGDVLFTCGAAAGLQSWPVHHAVAGGTPLQLQLGPPRQINLPFAPTRACRSQDDRSVAVVGESAGVAVLIDAATGVVNGPLLSHTNACYVALSPDAQWLATSGWRSPQTRLWNVRTGALAQQWEFGFSMVGFTPDGSQLVISESGGFSFWSVHPSQLLRRVPRAIVSYPTHVAFSPDGRLAALALSPGEVDLLELATGITVARLQSPPSEDATPMVLDPARLGLIALQSHLVHRWDLRAIRAGLKSMGLDWPWPEFPPISAAGPMAGSPLQIQVLGGGPR